MGRLVEPQVESDKFEPLNEQIWRVMTSPFRFVWKWFFFPIRWVYYLFKFACRHPKATLYTVVVVALVELLWLAVLNYDFAVGQRSGYLRKGSRRGILFKTYESQLDQRMTGGGAYHDNDMFIFSVVDPKAIKQIEEYEPRNVFVTVKYRERLFRSFWRGETKYFVTEVTVSGK
jgi:hypothetical protein